MNADSDPPTTPPERITERPTDRAARWFYRGLWRFLVDWLRVPEDRPSLPVEPGQFHSSFRPAEGFLRYLKFGFWIGLTLFDGILAITLIVIYVASPIVGLIVTLPMLILMILPDIVAYVAIHLRFDTTWYVMTDRSLRLRRGIWSIHEVTITFENVQNVKVTQGPLQRWFGIATVVVETAGGGGTNADPHHAGHHGMIEGISNAEEIRDLILRRLQHSRSAGLGDEAHLALRPTPGFSPDHVAVLREIREHVRALAMS
ncbi:MAG: PH domain-containing protein [Burkholderiales bacterium]|nr:PH domain-containing protein [Phycisphaerae bacterium]